ncbi:hypothetical protein SAMN02744778_04668 [Pantoea sp. GL120224-02]|jgi:hypothetical protein|nr:hypothetical protein SAMN02744778_04668 [Pantoea sp. GL120224-02]
MIDHHDILLPLRVSSRFTLDSLLTQGGRQSQSTVKKVGNPDCQPSSSHRTGHQQVNAYNRPAS